MGRRRRRPPPSSEEPDPRWTDPPWAQPTAPSATAAAPPAQPSVWQAAPAGAAPQPPPSLMLQGGSLEAQEPLVLEDPASQNPQPRPPARLAVAASAVVLLGPVGASAVQRLALHHQRRMRQQSSNRTASHATAAAWTTERLPAPTAHTNPSPRPAVSWTPTRSMAVGRWGRLGPCRPHPCSAPQSSVRARRQRSHQRRPCSLSVAPLSVAVRLAGASGEASEAATRRCRRRRRRAWGRRQLCGSRWTAVWAGRLPRGAPDPRPSAAAARNCRTSAQLSNQVRLPTARQPAMQPVDLCSAAPSSLLRLPAVRCPPCSPSGRRHLQAGHPGRGLQRLQKKMTTGSSMRTPKTR
mmetsp:Transcript_8650/g.25983  ORF Transcript_8650/g.25983 Transcript_8650/m.25983 type:complete len:352 (+) Transcript_8650:429-1484(+)